MINELLKLNETTEDRLVIIREFNAPPALVFEVLTKHKHIKNWYCPAGMEVVVSEGEFKVGGKYRLGMRKIGSEGPVMELVGECTEVSPPSKLKYTQGYKMPDGSIGMLTLIEITISQDEGKTQMVLQQSGFPDSKSRDSALKGGWPTAMDKLQELVNTIAN